MLNVQSLTSFVKGVVAAFADISFVDSTSGNQTTTVFTVTLPPFTANNAIILVVSRNIATTFSFESNVTATELADSGSGRLTAFLIEPDSTSETEFDVTVSNAVNTWWCASYANVDKAATIASGTATNGTNTSSTMSLPVINLDYIASGKELVFFAAGVNATAIWTTTPETVFNTTADNAAMMVLSETMTTGDIAVAYADVDRGNNGSNRLESSIGFVLQPLANTDRDNLITNGSFELGSGLATDWDSEGSVAGTPTYSLATSNIKDGKQSQRIQYAGEAGDTDTVFAIYQAPISDVSPGDVLTAEIYISGTLTNAYCLFGIEGFEVDTSYISEHSTAITSVDGTPTKYTVQYTCPALTDYVAVFIQFPEVNDPSDIDVYVDRVVMYK